jgi:hypothetical protein
MDMEIVKKVLNCDLDEDAVILAEYAERLEWPVIQVNESTNMMYYPDEDYVPDFSGEYFFDTRRLVENPDKCHDVGNVRYVANILAYALAGAKNCEASRKYSFGDTPDWWEEFAPANTEGRKIIQIDVSVNR